MLNLEQQARRQRVVDAAMALGAEGGYEAVQMRDVAARAGVAMGGTLHRYFSSKDHPLGAPDPMVSPASATAFPGASSGWGPGIEARNLTKRFGALTAVDDLSFSVYPGRVTGFLGPNGSGKTTTLRMLLGLVAPDVGQGLIGGVPYRDLPEPSRMVGAVLEASGFHPARSGRNHLLVWATAAGVARGRVDEMLELVGLGADARRAVGGYSLGMRQRLELARALLGDPGVLILDEPANGLDPQGIAWLRWFMRWYAGQGRIVLMSSHLLAEAAQVVDDVVIVTQGRLAAQGRLADLVGSAGPSVQVRTPDADRLAWLAQEAGWEVHRAADASVLVVGAAPEQVGRLMAEHHVVVLAMSALSPSSSLEELFFALTDRRSSPGAAGAASWTAHR